MPEQGVPSEIKKSKLKKGEYVSAYKDKLCVLKWKDRKDICLMSTTHDEAMIKQECRGRRIKKPKVAVDYNKTMGGVDLSDAYLVSYRSARKKAKEVLLEAFSAHVGYLLSEFLSIVCKDGR